MISIILLNSLFDFLNLVYKMILLLLEHSVKEVSIMLNSAPIFDNLLDTITFHTF